MIVTPHLDQIESVAQDFAQARGVVAARPLA